MQISLKKWVASGSPWVWLNAGAVAISVVLVLGLLGIIASRGLVHFWPASLQEYQYTDSEGLKIAVLGEQVEREQVTAEQIRNAGLAVPAGVDILDRQLIKVGNREVYGSDFRWVLEHQLSELQYPKTLWHLSGANGVISMVILWGLKKTASSLRSKPQQITIYGMKFYNAPLAPQLFIARLKA